MLTVGDIARMLQVHPKTVARWARRGQLVAMVTPGGHRRFPLAEVMAFLREMGFDDQAAAAAVRGVTS